MTSSAYKSRDVDYMTKLKKAILKGMRGRMPDEKTYTWEYVRKQVVLDDLHTYAIGALGRIVKFPTENFNGRVMVVFLNPPSQQELDILYAMLKPVHAKKEDVYITYVNKAEIETEEDSKILQKVLESEISVIKPELILSFGPMLHHEMHAVTDFKDAKLLVTYDMDYLFKESETPLVERKKALWNDVKQLISYYTL